MPNPFLWEPGTSNNGLYAPELTLMTTELNGLAAGSYTQSSVNGISGVFSGVNTGQVIVGELFFVPGNIGSMTTPGAGANLSFWFESTPDGTVFESATAAYRPPDAIIPLPSVSFTATAGTLAFKAVGLVRVPALKFYVLAQNNAGNSTGAGATTSNKLVLAPMAVQY